MFHNLIINAQSRSQIAARQNFAMNVGGNLVAQGVTANVGGSTSLSAGGNMQLTTALNGHVQSYDFFNRYKHSGGLIKVEERIERRDVSLTNSGNTWSSGGALNLAAGQDLSVVGAQINSQGYNATAGGLYEERAAYDIQEKVNIHAVEKSGVGVYINDFINTTSALATGGVAGGKSEKERVETRIDSTRTAVLTNIDAGNGSVNRTAGGDAVIEGSVIRGGVVNPLSAGGSVTAVAAVDSRHVEDSVFSSTIRWQSTKSQGAIEQTLHLPEIHGTIPAGLSAYQGAGGVSVQLPKGASVRTAIEALSKEPGKGYLAELGGRSDVDWQRVEALNKSLDFSKSGLTQEATIVVVIVVSILTYGTASGWGTAAANYTGSTAVGAAVTAGTTSLASTAAVSLINNKGDIGAVLKELGSQENLQGLALTMATAGLTQGLLDAIPADTATGFLNGVDASSSLGQLMAKNAVQGISSAVLESAVMGTDLEDALRSNLQGALINTLAAKGANAIGDGFQAGDLDKTSKAIAHALLGCAVGSANAGNSSGCAPGAAGAVIGELVADWYAESSGYDQLKIDANREGASAEIKQQLAVMTNTMTELAKLTGAGGALLIGGDATTMNLAMTTAQNAAQNNRQLHVDEIAWIKANAADFAKAEGISEDAAIARLSQQASKDIDLLMRARLSDGDDAKAQAFLSGVTATFINDNGTKQRLFTIQGQQLLRPEMFAESVDVKFVQQYVTPGFNRSLSTGLAKEFRDLGIDMSSAMVNGAIDMGKAAVNQPLATFNAVLDAVKGMPSAVWDGLTESGRSLGEGAAVMFGPDIQDKLNTLYATDVRSAQILLQTARVVTALGGAAGAGAAGKSAAEIGEAVGKQVGKKVDEILDQAALNALLKSGGVYDKTGQAILDLKQLSTAQKGMVGELLGADTVKQIIPDGERIARLPGVGETGIDDLYKVNRPDVDYVNIEYKFVGTDSKTGAQVLSKTQDGLQGSQTWIGGSGRIEKAVGADMGIEVDKALRAGRVESWVVTTRTDGSTFVQVLDAVGRPKPVDTSKLILPSMNLSGAKL